MLCSLPSKKDSSSLDVGSKGLNAVLRSLAKTDHAVWGSFLSPSTAVVIAGLQSEPATKSNGRKGVVVEFNLRSGRYEIALPDTSKVMVKPANLTILATLETTAGCINRQSNVDLVVTNFTCA